MASRCLEDGGTVESYQQVAACCQLPACDLVTGLPAYRLTGLPPYRHPPYRLTALPPSAIRHPPSAIRLTAIRLAAVRHSLLNRGLTTLLKIEPNV